MATFDLPLGHAKAWVNFSSVGTPAITDEHNVASISDSGFAGDYTINFTEALPNADYAVMATGYQSTVAGSGSVMGGIGRSAFAAVTKSTTAFRIGIFNWSTTQSDFNNLFFAFFST